MYNEELKQRFINSIDLAQYPDRFWDRVFAKAELLEKKNEKDICNFSTKELIEYYKSFESSSAVSLNVTNINLRKYAQFCLQNGLINDGQNHFYEIDMAQLQNCINANVQGSGIVTLEFLQHDILPYLLSEKDKFIFMSFFEGITGYNYVDLINLKISDIDMKNKTVNGCPVSDVFINAAIEADKELEYARNEKTIIKFIPSDTIFKDTEKSMSYEPETKRINIGKVVTRNIDRIGIGRKITPTSLVVSGTINYINKLADIHNVSGKDVLYDDKLFELIKKKYNFNRNVRKGFIIRYGNFFVE